MAMQWSMRAGRFVWCVFRVLEVALDQKNNGLGERPNVHGSALRGPNCMACTLYHAACTSVKVRTCDQVTVVTHNKFEVLGKRKPHRSKHALEGIVRIVNTTTKAT